MGEWTVKHDPNDGWYQYRIYDGDTLIVNVVAVGSYGKALADQIVSDHNARAALEAQVERLQEELDSHREYSSEMLQSAWLFRVAFSGYRTLDNGDRIKRARDRLFRSIDPRHVSQRKANEALATAGPGGGGEGDGRP